MSSPPSSGSSSTEDEKSWFKQVGRTRVFLFFYVFAIVALANAVVEEGDIFTHVVDDYADVIIAVVAIIIIAVMWRKKSTPSLRKANNIATVLAVLLIVATIYAITQEYNDPTDFGNEIPTLLFGIFMIINRFA